MEISNKQKQVNKLLGEIISEVLVKEFDFKQGVLVSVHHVVTSPDFQDTKVYLSVLPDEYAKDIVAYVNEKKHIVKQATVKQIKNKFRRMPELRFYLDDSIAYAEKMDELFNKINKNNPNDFE